MRINSFLGDEQFHMFLFLLFISIHFVAESAASQGTISAIYADDIEVENNANNEERLLDDETQYWTDIKFDQIVH
ncbi:unnamed protein product [Dracunculus medinensis]|uniref:Uncharacterized protein n=1 Tax=Dracunculus medinensis TaxID=318479 RepID=A0A0N4UB34_DRAME|nr:unnamed protein product [Dracunculus medinensis]